MKSFLQLFMFLFYSSFILSQVSQPNIYDKQFMIGIIKVPKTELVTHSISAIGQVWKWEQGLFTTGGIYNNSLVTLGESDTNDVSYWPGFNFNWCYGDPKWSLGLYKVTNSKQTGKYFYIDARDCDFGRALYNPDFFIYFDDSIGTYIFKKPQKGIIEQGAIIRVWDIHNKRPNTTLLQNYWTNALVIVNHYQRPKLIWGPYPSNNLMVSNYNIYRKYGGSQWQLLTSVPADVFEYYDMTVSLSKYLAGTDVSYKVTAVYSNNTENIETMPTNVVTVNVKGQNIENYQSNDFIRTSNFSLEQNFPNPFNPVTLIKFSINDNADVSLKIFDILGNVTKELFNGYIEKGDYSIYFDASGLPSGVYFYSLNMNGYTQTKKMILSK